ncbi:LysR family transcriptional regulator [Rhodococcus koreensis]|uniref:LysR family transcriptional regulator n=1 Tax=Rhodococcus sp. T2V TaxID=3034164 RepID=UPI0023E2C6AA|nr:LysR family transcriptional regulator [Rhodococcus sp. T2V]MDF3310123.1 LysR family transcriptional regulator [Rhodococcus sp. T2V]
MKKSLWSSIELRHFIALAEVGRTGSFTAAATSLGYTQSAVSQQIKRLETVVGQQLVERSGGAQPVALTTAGQVLVSHAEAIEARLASAEADLQALRDGVAGHLRLGSYESVGARILPHALKEFSTQWPHIQVVLEEHDDDEILLSHVERGELDLTFMVFPLIPGPFSATELLEDPYVLVVSDDSPLLHETLPLRLDRLSELPLATYGELRDVHGIAARLGRPSLSRQVIFRSNDNGTILGMAAQGLAVAVMPQLSVDPYQPGIKVLELERVSPRIVGIAWHNGRRVTPAMKAFIDVATTIAAQVKSRR